jgi:transposase-like protein
MEAKRKHIIYKEEFRRQAVEMVIHSGKTQAQVARELGCSEYSLNLWKKAYLRQQAPTEIDGGQCCKFVVEAKICVDDRQFSSTPRTDRE